jgi:hypothetical protein
MNQEIAARPPSVVPPALRSMIGEAVGEATMCWEHIDRAGVFKSTEAAAIVERIIDQVDDLLRNRDVTLLASLQIINFHAGQLTRRIRERAGLTDDV